jgi:hypothetical protein
MNGGVLRDTVYFEGDASVHSGLLIAIAGCERGLNAVLDA